MVKDLTKDAPWRAILTLSLPMLISVAFQQIYSIADSTLTVNLISSEYDKDVENYIKAYIQQYYDHAERKSYVVPANFSADNSSR